MEIVFGKTRFNRWIVLSVDSNPKFWNCRCDCGTERRVNKKNVKSGQSKSCGCLVHDVMTTHGMSKSRTYMLWNSMWLRVTDSKRYMDRGITICKEWEQFENFLGDMGECPEDKYSLDRIDNDGHYTPENCRWANRSEQQRNKRTTRMLTFQGRTQAASAWAEECGMTLSTLTSRLDRGWTVEKALTTPEGLKRGKWALQTKDRPIEFQGRTQTVEGWAKEFNLNLSTMIQRVWDRWPMERIAATPQGIRGGHRESERKKRQQADGAAVDC